MQFSKMMTLALGIALLAPARADGQAARRAVGHRALVNGMRMYYEVSGQGDPLIVLHGAYMNIPTMGAIIPKLAFPALVRKLIALEKEPMAWEQDVRALKTPVLLIAGDADVVTLEHAVAMFRLLGGGIMGDMGKPLPASRLAILPATSHTAVIMQPDLLYAFIEPFLKGVTPKGMFQ